MVNSFKLIHLQLILMRNYSLGAFNLGEAPRCVFRVGSRTLVGCFGLSSDSKILMDKLRSMLIDHYETENHSDLDSNSIAHVVSNILYESNLLLSPIVVGLDRDGKPSIVVMDELGIHMSSYNYHPFRNFLCFRCTD